MTISEFAPDNQLSPKWLRNNFRFRLDGATRNREPGPFPPVGLEPGGAGEKMAHPNSSARQSYGDDIRSPESSLDAARRSACATVWSVKLFLRRSLAYCFAAN